MRTYLADERSLAAAIAAIVAAEPAIDTPFNNAGVNPDRLIHSPRGRELDYEVNAVAPYLLARCSSGWRRGH